MTFADAIEAIKQDETLRASRRRDDISALTSLARILKKDPADVPANTAWLRQRLKQLHPKQVGISDKRLANIRSSVIGALRRYGAGTHLYQARGEMTAEWRNLFERVSDQTERYKFSRFFRWCSTTGITREQVTQDAVAAFQAMIESETLVKKPRKVVSNMVHAWNRCRDAVQGWPDVALVYEGTRSPWTFPLDTFPQSFQDDVDRWLGRLQLDDLFDDDAPSKPCRPATIKHRRFQIRMMASALVHTGRPIETIRSLADLVEVEAFKAALQYMMERQDGKSSEALFGLATGIKAIARHYVKVEAEHLEQLKRFCSRLDRTADRSRKRNRDRLDQFEDPINLQRLLHLPKRLSQPVDRLYVKKRGNLLRFQTAAAIEILLFCPMRIANLAGLDVDRHLRWTELGRSLTLHIHIPDGEVKNRVPLHYELTDESAVLVQRYIEDIRPQLCVQPTTALFPTLDGSTRRPEDLSQQIKRHIFNETGLTVNAHLFRSLAARIHALVNAGDYGTISHVLNDKIGTVMAAYANHDQKASLRRYRDSVVKVRDTSGSSTAPNKKGSGQNDDH